MHSLALALFSTLLLSPISAQSTYHVEEYQQPYQNHAEHDLVNSNSKYYKEDHRPHEPSYSKHSVERGHHTTHEREVKIAVIANIEDTVEGHKCRERQKHRRPCHGDNTCEKEIESCYKKIPCRVSSKKCLRGRKCTKFHKTCQLEDQNNFGYKCGKKFFSNSKIAEVGTQVCNKLGENKYKNQVPEIFKASQYYFPGPYYQSPISGPKKWYSSGRTNKYRIVMTEECVVVDVVILNKKGKDYSHCKYEKE